MNTGELTRLLLLKGPPLATLIRFIQEFEHPQTSEQKTKIRFELFSDTVPGFVPPDTITCLDIYPGQEISIEIDELGLA